MGRRLGGVRGAETGLGEAHRNLALLSRTLFASAPNASRARRRVGSLWGLGRNSGCRASAVNYTPNFVIGVASFPVGWIARGTSSEAAEAPRISFSARATSLLYLLKRRTR